MALKSPAAKGKRMERGIVKALEEAGAASRRQPSSGAFGTRVSEARLQGDVKTTIGGRQFLIEAKARKNGEGFATLERWKQGCDILWLKRDRQEAMVVLSEGDFLWLVGLVEGRDE